MRVSHRRIELNTSKLAAGCTLFVLSLGMSSPSWAAARPAATQILAATAAHGQAPKTRATPKERKEAEKLLDRARQAMREGNLETADSLIARAEAMNVDYGMFHVGDTPKKARHDLDVRRKMARSENKKPSEKFRPELTTTDSAVGSSRAPAAATEPSKERTTSQLQAPQTDDASGLPGIGRKDTALTNSPFKRHATNAPPADLAEEADLSTPASRAKAAAAVPAADSTADPSARRKCDALLSGARRALAQGDIRRATAQVEEAKKLNVTYDFHDDSPVKVEAMVRKAKEVNEIRASRPDSEAARHQYADLLMEQAEQLLRWKEYDEAERLAMDAGRLKANYGPFDTKPDALIGQDLGPAQRTLAQRQGRGRRGRQEDR